MRRLLLILVAFSLVGCDSPPSASVNIEATVQAAVQATMTAGPDQRTPSLTTEGPGPSLSIPARPQGTMPGVMLVMHTGGEEADLRTEPNGDLIAMWPEMAIMTLVGPGQEVYGVKWSHVKDPDGNIGWIASKFLGLPKPFGHPYQIVEKYDRIDDATKIALLPDPAEQREGVGSLFVFYSYKGTNPSKPATVTFAFSSTS